ncbi:MAG: hypothetical protein U0V87_15140 [Acidobacteriota bacterium]
MPRTAVERWGARFGQRFETCCAAGVALALARFGQRHHSEVLVLNPALRGAALQAAMCCNASVD